jgi:hypothetical protein
MLTAKKFASTLRNGSFTPPSERRISRLTHLGCAPVGEGLVYPELEGPSHLTINPRPIRNERQTK